MNIKTRVFEDFDFQCDWPNIFMPWHYNWIDFCIVKLEGRWDKVFGKVDVDIGLLGFKISACWVYDRNTPARKRLEADIEQLRANGFMGDDNA